MSDDFSTLLFRKISSCLRSLLFMTVLVVWTGVGCVGYSPDVTTVTRIPAGHQSKMRKHASGRRALHMSERQEACYTIRIQRKGRYEVRVRYSDDGGGDYLKLLIDGTAVGDRWITRDTRPPNGCPGSGWDHFVWTAPAEVMFREEDVGVHTNTLVNEGSDGWGVDVDCIEYCYIENEEAER